jgi:hypothetical protein
MSELKADHTVELRLRCRFDGHSEAAVLVEYEHGCVCYPDKLQALCFQHAHSGLAEKPGRVVAFLNPGRLQPLTEGASCAKVDP